MSIVWLIKNKEFVRYKYELVAHIFAKTIFISPIIYSGYLHGIWNTLFLLATYSVYYSLFAFLLLYNDHEENHNVLALSENINPHHKKLSWAETQVRTSGNWYPTNWILSFVEFHYGYFNYHIEHHLFPSFKPSLLKKVSPIVKSVCEKYNIPYISTTFIEVQQSFQGHITKMGLS
ncbi:MAG: fatty acid desaturase [Cyanobacteria bacterium P01_F01_bin.53]